jgi:SET domain-containing protein
MPTYAGWGLFTADALEKDDFIYEYMGEVISHEEADRYADVC